MNLKTASKCRVFLSTDRGSASSKESSRKTRLFIWSVPTAFPKGSDYSILRISPVLSSMSVRRSLKLFTGGKGMFNV